MISRTIGALSSRRNSWQWSLPLRKDLNNPMPIPRFQFWNLSSVTSLSYSAPSPALSFARSAYRCSAESNYHTNPTRPFIGFETLSIPSSILDAICSSNLNASSVLHNQECYRGSVNNYRLKDCFLRFGDEVSCSSSDGTSTNQISYGKEAEQDYGVSNGERVDLQFFYAIGLMKVRSSYLVLTSMDVLMRSQMVLVGEIH